MMQLLLALFGAVLASTSLAQDSGLPTAVGDPEQGETLYARCVACHAVAYNRTGPKHCGLNGRQVGSLPDYAYSKAMKEADFVWNKDTLDWFLESPLEALPGTSMGFAGIKDPTDRRNIVAFLLGNGSCD